nr:MAG TPA: hypothetical protein [Inoviridae sp.]
MLQWLISKTPPKLPSESRKHRKAHWLRSCGSGGSEGARDYLIISTDFSQRVLKNGYNSGFCSCTGGIENA